MTGNETSLREVAVEGDVAGLTDCAEMNWPCVRLLSAAEEKGSLFGQRKEEISRLKRFSEESDGDG